jgi:hypothetical protein
MTIIGVTTAGPVCGYCGDWFDQTFALACYSDNARHAAWFLFNGEPAEQALTI